MKVCVRVLMHEYGDGGERVWGWRVLMFVNVCGDGGYGCM